MNNIVSLYLKGVIIMAYRNGNYSAFYVSEPFSESNLGAHATKDFLYYCRLPRWLTAIVPDTLTA